MKGNRPGAQPIVRVRGLTKSFGPLKAVDGVDLDIQGGESFALLGPNGAGKSTTIKMMMGLLPPDGGEVEINGYSLRRQPLRVRQSVGYVPQSLSVDGALTGRENLYFFGRFYGLSGAEVRRRIPGILEMLDLEEAASRPVATYSGGMIRRLEIGQAVLHRPPLVFLDEPTVGMDPVSREALWKHIRALQSRQGTTVLLTTHYMEEAESLCSRIAIMAKGKVAALGNLAQLRRQAGLPQASLNRIFIHFAGKRRAGEEDSPEDSGQGLLSVKRSRRVARRLG